LWTTFEDDIPWLQIERLNAAVANRAQFSRIIESIKHVDDMEITVTASSLDRWSSTPFVPPSNTLDQLSDFTLSVSVSEDQVFRDMLSMITAPALKTLQVDTKSTTAPVNLEQDHIKHFFIRSGQNIHTLSWKEDKVPAPATPLRMPCVLQHLPALQELKICPIHLNDALLESLVASKANLDPGILLPNLRKLVVSPVEAADGNQRLFKDKFLLQMLRSRAKYTWNDEGTQANNLLVTAPLLSLHLIFKCPFPRKTILDLGALRPLELQVILKED
jgi:hypothetical protein